MAGLKPYLKSPSVYSRPVFLLCGLQHTSPWFPWCGHAFPQGNAFHYCISRQWVVSEEMITTSRKQISFLSASKNVVGNVTCGCSLSSQRHATCGSFCFQAPEAHPGKKNALWTPVPIPVALALSVLHWSCAHPKSPGWHQNPHQDDCHQDRSLREATSFPEDMKLTFTALQE